MTTRTGLLVALVLGVLSVQGLPVVASQQDIEVSGRLVQVMSEETAEGADHIHVDDDVDIITMVEVDGDLIALADPVDGATGDEVTITVEGAGRATGAKALAAAADESNPATVVDIDVVSADDTLLAAGSNNTLTILPVYWSGSSSVTSAPLKALGEATAAYWSQQSGGAITTSVVVKPWIDARTTAGVSVPTSCSNQAMATLVTQLMAAQGYTSPSTAKGRVSVFFPYWNICGWAGLGSVGGSYSWINGYTNVEILAHEFGHNLGLGHANRYDCGSVALSLPTSACAGYEYGDSVDVMGSGTLTGKPGNLNPAMSDYLGLTKTVKATAGTTTTTTLGALGSTGSVRAVTIPVNGGTVYVGFRPHVSPDTRNASWAGVQVHMQVMDSYFPTSYLLDMHPAQNFANPTLGAGETWKVPGTSLEVTVNSVNGTTSATVTVTAPVTLGSDLGFVPVTPARLLDTRTGTKVGPNQMLDVKVAGVAGVPSNAQAVALNVTAVEATTGTWIRTWPAGVSEPASSTLNTRPGAATAAATVLGVGSGGKVRLRNNAGAVHLIVDVTGYYVSNGGSNFTPLSTAVRLYDSRLSGGHASGKTERLQVAGTAGVPSNATAVMVNVTSAAAKSGGFISVVPAGADPTKTSAVNLWGGTDVANRATVPLSGGKIDVYLAGGPSGVVIDLVGWYGPSGDYRLTPVAPQRMVDTRLKGGRLGTAETRTVALRDAIVTSKKPAAAVATITATGQTAGTYMTVGALGRRLPPTSDLNTGPGRDQAAMVLFVWDSAGKSVVYNNAGSTHVVIDVTAVFR
ncbi:MAG: hypothetical protein FWD11_02480 [Micrococcales bacterium]|nr:hypothetical protein [Micrococcales bacterium]